MLIEVKPFIGIRFTFDIDEGEVNETLYVNILNFKWRNGKWEKRKV